jgi:hypothetical protein
MADSFSVTFSGFKTKEEAKHFADWYSGSGEQNSSIWLEEWAGIDFAGAKYPFIETENNIEVELKITYVDR